MNKYLLLFILMVWAGNFDFYPSVQSGVILEGDIVIANELPMWGEVCIASAVRGGPSEMYTERYSVSNGQVVRLHESSKPYGDWVSIGVAQWMPLKNICEWNGE